MDTSSTKKKKKVTTKKTKREDQGGDDNKRRVKKQKLNSGEAASTTTEEAQWHKMMKLQSATAATTKVKKETTTKKTSPVKQQQKEKKTKKVKKNKLDKHREPSDMMINASLTQKMAAEIREYESIDAEHYEQKALAIHVMPARENQTIETLALTPSAALNHTVFNDLEYAMAMQKANYERHQAAVESGVTIKGTTSPLENLMVDGGFMAIDQANVEPIFRALSKEIRQNINFAKANKSDSPTSRKKRIGGAIEEDGDAKQAPTVKKLNLVFGNTYHSFGYHKRTPQAQHKRIEALDQVDRFERFKERFRDDQLEEETNFGELPRNFKMFRDLCAKNMEKYKRRHETQRDVASLIPKVSLEEVTKEYIRRFREPPGKNDDLCSSGTECVFYTFSDDKNVKYIGKVFYTENEKRRQLEAHLLAAKRRQKQHDHMLHGDSCHADDDDDDDEECTYNRHKLCIDCLLRLWTRIYFRNIADGVVPSRPINYFTVACGRGQYSPKVMLNVIENKRPTGIMGHVPRFAVNKRCIVILEASVFDAGKYHSIFVPCLAETGMDF